MKDGWHVLQGCDVYVRNGKIVRGTKDNHTLPAFVYRWDRKYNAWLRECRITPAAFVAGIKRGTIILN